VSCGTAPLSHQGSAGRRKARGMAGLLACGSPPPFPPSRFPSGRTRPRAHTERELAAHSCGGSHGLARCRAHRRSLFISRMGEPSGATVNEDDRPGQSNARRKLSRKVIFPDRSSRPRRLQSNLLD
jgi:hypothetical protein